MAGTGEPRSSATRRLAYAAATALFIAAGTWIACLAAFSTFKPYDDEGYVLVSLRGYLGGAALYRHLYSQYGPFFYQLIGGVFRILGIAPTNDVARIATIALWLGTSVLCGLAVSRLSRSRFLGLSAQLLTFSVLRDLVNEPLHPVALIGLLLVWMIAVIAFLYPTRLALALAWIGSLTAAIALVKINVGILAAVSVLFACVSSRGVSPRTHRLRPLCTLLFVSFPFVLMARDLGQDWARRYAILVALSAACVAVASHPEASDDQAAPRQLQWVLWGSIGLAVFSLGLALVLGTGIPALVHGIITAPVNQPAAFTVPLTIPLYAFAFVIVGSAAALSARQGRLLGNVPSFPMGLFRFASGIVIWLSLAGIWRLPRLSLEVGLPFAWVAAVPRSRDPAQPSRLARSLLPSLAVLQALHAYPVAGTQVALGSLLLVPVGGVCLSDGTADLREALVNRGSPARSGTGMRLLGAMVVALVALASIGGWPARAVRAYRSGVPLGLPGASRLRLEPEVTGVYRSVTAAIRRDCRTFVSLPGMNSFYLFSGERPPTQFNATAWMYLFDTQTQLRIVRQVGDLGGLCAVRNRNLVSFWTRGRHVPEGPLAQFIEAEFRPAYEVGGYEILTRSSRVTRFESSALPGSAYEP